MSSNPVALRSMSAGHPGGFGMLSALLLAGLALAPVPVAAQDDTPVTRPVTPDEAAPSAAAEPTGDEDEDEEATPLRINLAVTVPRGEVNEAQAQECEDRAEAGEISGEIIVCRRLGDDGSNSLSSSRAEARKRYAEATAFKNAPRTPDVSGLPDNGRGIGIGGVPPPALIIDVGALPDAPPGSDADRIARGLPPLGQDEELSEEEIRKRREALGLPPPAFGKKKKN